MAKVCPECCSTKIVKCGWSVVKREKIQRYRCTKCLRTFIHPKWSGSKRKEDASKQSLNGSTVVLDEETED